MEQRVIGGLSSLLIDQLQSSWPATADRCHPLRPWQHPMSTNRTSLEVWQNYIRRLIPLIYAPVRQLAQHPASGSNNDEVTLDWHFFTATSRWDLMGGDREWGA